MKKTIYHNALIFLFISSYISSFGQEFLNMEYLLSYDRQTIINDYGIPATNGVDLYKVRYTSKDLVDQPDTLSGLVAIPDTEDMVHPLLVYAHGTVGSREDVPSRLSGEHLIAALFGSLGYFSLAPDYLGLGDSKGIHPYVHADSEALACYDMIKAIRTSAEENDFLINNQNFIFGYSQGGHAAMALHRYMETENNDGYVVTAAAPSSGPYSISGEMKDFTLSDEEYFFVAYLASVAISYQEAYGDIFSEEGLYSFFKPEYADEIEKYALEEIDLFELNQRLIDLLVKNHGKSIPKFMIQDKKLDEILNNPESPVNKALEDNDVFDWAPQAPTRLFYCMSDDQVKYTNSLVAEAAMVSNGAADVASLDVGTSLSHTECVPNAITLTIFFFDEYKSISSGTYLPQAYNEQFIYPNPANNYIIITNKNGEIKEGKATIMDLNGRIISRSVTRTGLPISVEGVASGQYILIWSSGEINEVHRLMIMD